MANQKRNRGRRAARREPIPDEIAGRGRERELETKPGQRRFLRDVEDSAVAGVDWQQTGQGGGGGDADAERMVIQGAENTVLLDMEQLESPELDHVLWEEEHRPRSLDQPRKKPKSA